MLRKTILAGLGLMAVSLTTAQASTQIPDELKRLKDEIARAEAARDADVAERTKLTSELDALRKETIALAAEIQTLERDLTATETRINDLAGRDHDLTAALNDRRNRIAPLLAALQRLRRDLPPAIAVVPEDAISAARSAMLIAGVAEKLEAEANSLAADLRTLGETRTALVAERDQARARRAAIDIRTAELGGLISQRQTAVASLGADVAAAETALAAMQAKAADMAELMAWIEETPASPSPAGVAADGNSTLERDDVRFEHQKGHLAWPAVGTVTGRFGDAHENGDPAKGLTILTRNNAQVTAPADGEIVFAGPFDGYDQLLILTPAEGYFVVIGGLGHLDAIQGQHVLAGEPVGTMAGSATEATMYLELRRKGVPVDPLPWLIPVEPAG